MTLSLMSLAGAAAFGVSSLASGKTALEVRADSEPETYISATDLQFSNTEGSGFNGQISPKTRTYWNEHYSHFALDEFISTGFSDGSQVGYDNESWTGTLKSRTWKQYTKYVYFQLGAAKDFDTYDNSGVKLVFHIGEYNWEVFNNTFLDGRMLLRYTEVPDDVYPKLDKENGFDMSVEIVDNRNTDWGLLNFGYFHANATLSKIGEEMRHYINNIPMNFVNNTERDHAKAAYAHYYGNAELKAAFLQTADVAEMDEHFSSNETFLKDWYFDFTYFNCDGATYYPTSAISTATYRPDGDTNMPYNNEGGFFRGWHYNDGGFVGADAPKYRFKSRPFVLPVDGSGLISVKMANRASLHVIDADDPANSGDSYDFAWIDNRKQNTINDEAMWNISDSGANYCTMVRHVINLEQFKGKKIQLAIADVETGGWGAAYFDEVIVNYGANTGFAVDKVTQTNSHGTSYNAIPDVYVNKADIRSDASGIDYTSHVDSKPTTDTGDRKAAYDFISSYYALVRGNTAFCDHKNSNEMKSLLSDYDGLSENAKAIVRASSDFHYNKNPIKDSSIEPTIISMAASIDLFLAWNESLNASNSILGNLNNATTANTIAAVSILLLGAGVAVAAFAKHKKKHN